MRLFYGALFLLAVTASAQDVEVYIEPYDYIDNVVLKELDKATASAALVYYHISLPSIRDKIVELKNKGVALKVLVDARTHAKDDWDEQLETLGIPVRRIPNIRSTFASMHKKFLLVDGKTVVAGSGNLSATGTQSNHENAVLIRSPLVAAIYDAELKEAEAVADYMESVFSPVEMNVFIQKSIYPSWWLSKKQVILKKIWWMEKPTPVQSIPWLRTYFSPDDQCHKVILAELEKATFEVFVAVFSLTRKDLAQKLVDLKKKGIRVEVITDKNQAAGPAMAAVNALLQAGGVPHVKARNWNAFFAAMHHKFCVIDRKTTVTGAYNWSYGATSSNEENLHVIQSDPIARRFGREFVSLMAQHDQNFKASNYDGNLSQDPKTEVAFVCSMSDTQADDTVCVAGNIPELGSWDPLKAVPLRTGSSTFPSWIGSVPIATGTPIEFKFIVRRASGAVDWENGWNRTWTVPVEGYSITIQGSFKK